MVSRPQAARVAGAAAIAFTLMLTGCAPEPGDIAGSTGKDEAVVNPETEWGGQTIIEEELVTTLPDSFPRDQFALPDSAVIKNTGEKSDSSWFVVLLAEDRATADALWRNIIENNQLVVVEESENELGAPVATLESAGIDVFAMMIPSAEGPVELSYELQSWG